MSKHITTPHSNQVRMPYSPLPRRHLLLSGLLLIFGLVLCVTSVQAQVQDFTVDGIHILLEPTKANQIVAVLVGIEGGIGRMDADNPALPGMTAAVAVASGSDKYPKSKYREELSRLVTTIDAGAAPYVTRYMLSCVKPKFTESWDIFADVLSHPQFDDEEFARLREQTLQEIAGRKASPEGYGNFLQDSMWCSSVAAWTPSQAADVKALTVQQMRDLHAKMLERSRMTIVVVGDISRAEITKLIHRDLGKLPTGNFTRTPYPIAAGLGKTDLVVDNRVLPTAYIFGRYLAPPKSSSDYWALMMGGLILSDRLYEEVRTKRNLSYAPYSGVSGSMGRYIGEVSVSTIAPDSCIHVITRELQKIRTSGITAKELKDRGAEFVTEFYMSQQSNLAQASRLYTTLLETNDWRHALNVVKELRQLKLEDVNRAMAKYLHDVFWVAVGEQSKMTKQDFLFQ